MDTGFPKGSTVLIDGRDLARVVAYFPEGSTSYSFPHYRLDVIRGDKNIAVRSDRVGCSSSQFRERKTGIVLRADVTERKVAVFYDDEDHCGQPSWMTKAKFHAKFEPVKAS